MAWYKQAQQSKSIVVYHGTSASIFKEIQQSGFLRASGVANLTTKKQLARSYAAEQFGEEDIVVLTFKAPLSYIDSGGTDKDNLLVLLRMDLPLSFMTKAESFKPKPNQPTFEGQLHEKLIPKPEQVSGYEQQKQELLKTLARNPQAYIPAYMRNDPDLKRYIR